jgi:ABC-type nitrate/sulfonate/bicarbonate transport system substrate-binding protein
MANAKALPAAERQPMKNVKPNVTVPRKEKARLRVGFVPLNDCAPLVVAQELCFFSKYGVAVNLIREAGWATIRDKIIFGELDAAQALASLPVTATLGLGSVRCECVAPIILNLEGNAITLSQELIERGVNTAKSLAREIARARGKRTFTFAVTFPFSSHKYLMRQWLVSGGIDPVRDVRIVVVPPPQMVSHLKAGHLDGYCVGEPWNTAAVQTGVGGCVAVSRDLAPYHPEKVIMARRQFSEDHAPELRAFLAALLEACAFCDQPENHEQIIALLARPEYLNIAAKVVRPGMAGSVSPGLLPPRGPQTSVIFSEGEANRPTAAKAARVADQIHTAELPVARRELTAAAARAFDSHLFEAAEQLVLESNRHEPVNVSTQNETAPLTA